METPIPIPDPVTRQDLLNLLQETIKLSTALRVKLYNMPELNKTPEAERVLKSIGGTPILRSEILRRNPKLNAVQLDHALTPLLVSGEIEEVKRPAPSGKGRPSVLYRRVDRES